MSIEFLRCIYIVYYIQEFLDVNADYRPQLVPAGHIAKNGEQLEWDDSSQARRTYLIYPRVI